MLLYASICFIKPTYTYNGVAPHLAWSRFPPPCDMATGESDPLLRWLPVRRGAAQFFAGWTSAWPWTGNSANLDVVFLKPRWWAQNDCRTELQSTRNSNALLYVGSDIPQTGADWLIFWRTIKLYWFNHPNHPIVKTILSLSSSLSFNMCQLIKAHTVSMRDWQVQFWFTDGTYSGIFPTALGFHSCCGWFRNPAAPKEWLKHVETP